MNLDKLIIKDTLGKALTFKSKAQLAEYAEAQAMTPKRIKNRQIHEIDLKSYIEADADLLVAGFTDPINIQEIYAYGNLGVKGLGGSERYKSVRAVLTNECIVLSWKKRMLRFSAIIPLAGLTQFQSDSTFICRILSKSYLILNRKGESTFDNQVLEFYPIFKNDGHENRRTFILWSSLVARLQFGLDH